MEVYLYKNLRLATGPDAYHLQPYRPDKGWPSVTASQGGSVRTLLTTYVSVGIWQAAETPAELTIEQAAEAVLRFTENAIKVLDCARGMLDEAVLAERSTKLRGEDFDDLFTATEEG